MSDDQPKLTRQQIYEKIRESSKDEYILGEMKRLGFWPDSSDKPSAAERLIERRAELNSELRQLGRDKALYENPEQALKEVHKQRKKEALEKREQTRQQNNKVRYERAVSWHEKQKDEITWLGHGISLGLDQHTFDPEKLASNKLPIMDSPKRLADSMGLSLSELRFLGYKKRVSQHSHYQHFSIPKKLGGVRDIAAPMPRLKRAQYWVLGNILNQPDIHSTAHGFIQGRSILSNAAPHVAKDVVINMDLENFFPTISFKRVKGLFHKFGYSEAVATVLASICTDADQALVELDGQTFYVDQTESRLPQGAPTSPAISNLICRRLDLRIEGAARKLGFAFTRYADDLTFSGNEKSGNDVQQLLWRIKKIIASEGFKVHPKKTRIMRKHRHQEVTGIVVNDKLNVDRKTLRKFRALLHQIEKNGPDGKSWGNGELIASIKGYANFVAMVNPEKGRSLQLQTNALAKQCAQPLARHKQVTRGSFRALSEQGKQPMENWWQAASKEPPVLELTKAQIEEERNKEKAAKKASDDAIQKKQSSPASERSEQQSDTPAKGRKAIGKASWLDSIIKISYRIFLFCFSLYVMLVAFFID